MFYDRTTNNRINRVHERALRIAYKDHRNYFGYPLEQSNSMPIHVRNLQLLMTEIFKTKSHLNLPFMKDIFQERNMNYNLRQGNDAQVPVHLFIYFCLFMFESLLHIGRQVHSGLFSYSKYIYIKDFQYKFFSTITFPHHHMDLTSNMQQT